MESHILIGDVHKSSNFFQKKYLQLGWPDILIPHQVWEKFMLDGEGLILKNHEWHILWTPPTQENERIRFKSEKQKSTLK